MSQPDSSDIMDIARNFYSATTGSEKAMEHALDRLQKIKDYFAAYAEPYETDEFAGEHGAKIADEQMEARWIEDTLRQLAKVRDATTFEIKALVMYAAKHEVMKPQHLAYAANVGPATVHRWKDATPKPRTRKSASPKDESGTASSPSDSTKSS